MARVWTTPLDSEELVTRADELVVRAKQLSTASVELPWICLLYTSDAADERSSVDLGGRRIIKKKKKTNWSGT